MGKRLAQADKEMERGLAALTVLGERNQGAMLRWLLLCWLTTGGALILLKVL